LSGEAGAAGDELPGDADADLRIHLQQVQHRVRGTRPVPEAAHQVPVLRRRADDQEVFRVRDEEQRRVHAFEGRGRAVLLLLVTFLQPLWLNDVKEDSLKEDSPLQSGANKRLLGDKWLDWNGREESGAASADTAITVSLVLAGVVAVLLVALLLLLWYLVTPRLAQFHPAAPWVFGFLIVGISLFVFAMGGSLILTLRAKKNLLLIRSSSKVLLDVVSILQRLGKRFGITADRVSNSLLKVNNALVLATVPFTGKESVLLLLPRCLTREIRQEIVQYSEGLGLKHAVCAGGEDARKKILLEQPNIVVAVACERDLIAGLRDIRGKIPVIGIPNSRPQGPCKCTELNVEEFVKTLRHLRGGKAERASHAS
jgi:hypothetical protein